MLHSAASSAHAVQCDGQPSKRREIGWVANRQKQTSGFDAHVDVFQPGSTPVTHCVR